MVSTLWIEFAISIGTCDAVLQTFLQGTHEVMINGDISTAEIMQQRNQSSCLAGTGAEVFADFNTDSPALLVERGWSGNPAGSPAQSYQKTLQTPLRNSCMKTCRELCRNSPQEFLHARLKEDKL
ncbi:hypothetical protein QAD02_020648 [Eretmocerus hayati]|uniref:Uncharacterized protein n=1 Tax=Eretmocerus hayati TaxID=131215 RepID=A0ACC2PST6_9HYME|nr:hypothetical protein QAD02_020648 [Eretmocerus hayati]